MKARVLNLKDKNPLINHDTLSDALTKEFFNTYQAQCEVFPSSTPRSQPGQRTEIRRARINSQNQRIL